MRARLLVFDPDIEGRRFLSEALSIPGLDLSLIVRASAETAVRALKMSELDGILIGLPAELSDLIHFIHQLHHSEHCPALFFVHKDPPPQSQWLTKDARGIEQLRETLAPMLRSSKLQAPIDSMPDFLHQVAGRARSHLANGITETLGELGVPAMYVSVDAAEFVWELRSSTFAAEVDAQVVAITDALGGVSTPPKAVSGALKRLITGEIKEHTFSASELVLALLPNAESEIHQRLVQLLGVSEIHTLALRTGNILQGFLLLGHAPHALEREAFLKLACRFGRLMEQAERMDLKHQQARSMRALQEVMLGLSATLDADDLLETVLERLEEVVPFDLAAIALIENGEYRMHASRGVPSGMRLFDAADQAGDEFVGIAARLMQTAGPVRLESRDLGDALQPETPAFHFETWIGVPISWGADQLGYLLLACKEHGVLEPIHLEISIGFGRQLAIALKNAQLLQGSRARAERMRLVNEIGRYAVSVLDTQQLVEAVASRVCEVFGCFAVRILLLEGDELVPYALNSVAGELAAPFEESYGVKEVQEFERALKQDQPVNLDSGSPRWKEIVPVLLTGARSAAFIPLSVASEVIGIMEIYTHSTEAMRQEDVDVLRVLAAQIAISVVNARLFNEIRSHALELESRVELRTQELQSQKERTEAILRSVADAILVLDLQGEVVLTNPPGQELLTHDQSGSLTTTLRELFAAEGVVQSSIEVGEVTYQALASPVELNGAAQGTVVVLRDITRLRALDELKSQFVATVSHELRTPLTNIKLYLSLLRSVEEEKRARYHKVLVSETERLSDMIEDLLNLSRLEAQQVIEKEEISLHELLRTVADTHLPACVNKGIRFTTDFSKRQTILADGAQIIQVFTNLLANAIAYTPVGGAISLKIAGPEDIDGETYAKVVLQDTGIGIRKEDLPHVFDRFYRGAGAQIYKSEGSGLGLAIVREILDNHDALVAVDSQPGEGTKITVWLPAVGE